MWLPEFLRTFLGPTIRKPAKIFFYAKKTKMRFFFRLRLKKTKVLGTSNNTHTPHPIFSFLLPSCSPTNQSIVIRLFGPWSCLLRSCFFLDFFILPVPNFSFQHQLIFCLFDSSSHTSCVSCWLGSSPISNFTFWHELCSIPWLVVVNHCQLFLRLTTHFKDQIIPEQACCKPSVLIWASVEMSIWS